MTAFLAPLDAHGVGVPCKICEERPGACHCNTCERRIVQDQDPVTIGLRQGRRPRAVKRDLIDHGTDEDRRVPRVSARPALRVLLVLALLVLAPGVDAKPRPSRIEGEVPRRLHVQLPRELERVKLPMAHIDPQAVPADGLPLEAIIQGQDGRWFAVVLARDASGRAVVARFEPLAPRPEGKASSGRKGR